MIEKSDAAKGLSERDDEDFSEEVAILGKNKTVDDSSLFLLVSSGTISKIDTFIYLEDASASLID